VGVKKSSVVVCGETGVAGDDEPSMDELSVRSGSLMNDLSKVEKFEVCPELIDEPDDIVDWVRELMSGAFNA
jgi:hypothetical protein